MKDFYREVFAGLPLWHQLILAIVLLVFGFLYIVLVAGWLAWDWLSEFRHHLTGYAGAAFGICGTLLLAINNQWSGWGFVFYLVSNAFWIAFALKHGHRALLWQNFAFVLAGLYGVYRWLL